jgi:hypothetical protein
MCRFSLAHKQSTLAPSQGNFNSLCKALEPSWPAAPSAMFQLLASGVATDLRSLCIYPNLPVLAVSDGADYRDGESRKAERCGTKNGRATLRLSVRREIELYHVTDLLWTIAKYANYWAREDAIGRYVVKKGGARLSTVK